VAVIARSSKQGGTTNLQDGQFAVANDVNSDMVTLFSEINGELDDGNVKTAEMPGAKSFRWTEISDPSNPSSNDVLGYASDEGGISVLQTQDSDGKKLALGKHTLLGAATGDSAKGGAVGVIHATATTVQTGANTTETTHSTYTLPANALSANGMALRIRGTWRTAANANTKRIRIYFGATPIMDTGAVGFNSHAGIAEMMVIRQSATAQVATGYVASGVSGGAVGTYFNFFSAPAETLSGTVEIKQTLTNGSASAGDIIGDTFTVEVLHVA
jgi:hypothetical protein